MSKHRILVLALTDQLTGSHLMHNGLCLKLTHRRLLESALGNLWYDT